nr:photosystem I subunit J [Ceratostigma ulicinum]WBR75418.1 photosystem I subunit J [Ceratostigma ulicinum]WBR75502.1 photosystem I subunit J [Ceratostigma ulicinum]
MYKYKCFFNPFTYASDHISDMYYPYVLQYINVLQYIKKKEDFLCEI